MQHSVPGSDYLNAYKPVTESILHGKGFTINGEICTIVPPGYPLILSIIFLLSHLIGIEELKLIVLFNVPITAASSALLFLIAESIFKKRIALISSLLWMTYPFNLWLIKNPNTEVPGILLLYLGTWMFILAVRKKHAGIFFLAGVIFGLASLIRPINLFLPLVLSFITFFLLKEIPRKTILLSVIIFLIGTLMTILPWEIYVFSKTGKIIILFSIGSAGTIASGFDHTYITVVGGSRAIVPNDVLLLMERIQGAGLNTLSKTFIFFIREPLNNPVAFLKLIGLKMARSFYATSQMWWEKETMMVQTPYLLTGFFGIGYAIKKHKEKIKNIILLLSIVLYFWTMTTLTISILRYMISAMGLLMIFSASTVSVILNKLKKGN